MKILRRRIEQQRIENETLQYELEKIIESKKLTNGDIKKLKDQYKIASGGWASEHENYENAMDRINELEKIVKTLVKMKEEE
ncbi:MAG: hypothetical protein ACTSRI_22075 [Promethearchaeota archaeon]